MSDVLVAVISGVVSGFVGGVAGGYVVINRRSTSTRLSTKGANSPAVGRDYNRGTPDRR